MIRGAKRLIKRSEIETSRLVTDHAASHLDPLVAAPRRNAFLKSVVPFLKKSAQAADSAFFFGRCS